MSLYTEHVGSVVSWRRRGALLLVLTLALSAAAATLFAAPAQAHSSTIVVLGGQVFVRRSAGPFVAIRESDVLVAGDTIRTGSASYSVVTFFDGTTIELEPDTEITLDALRARSSGDKVIEITQAVGRTWHVVTHLVGTASRYVVHTANATAAVRGTAFEVEVQADGTTRTKTTDGDVVVNAKGVEVHVLAGQQTTVLPGAAPSPVTLTPEPSRSIAVSFLTSPTALVTDAAGRSTGIRNGALIRYIPGSAVERAGDQFSISVPDPQLGALITSVRPAAPTTLTVDVQTQIFAADVMVANFVVAQPVLGGMAKGAIILQDGAAVLVSSDDARNAPDPLIGQLPSAPANTLVSQPVPAPLPGLTILQPAAAAVSSPSDAPLVAPLDLQSAAVVMYPVAHPVASGTDQPQVVPASLPLNSGVVTPVVPLPPVFAVTAAPTAAPTPAGLVPVAPIPTIPPPAIPTAMPSVAPTVASTAAPNLVPALAPLAVPTLAPTVAPTVAPTAAPTIAPTLTAAPTLPAPTIAPLSF